MAKYVYILSTPDQSVLGVYDSYQFAVDSNQDLDGDFWTQSNQGSFHLIKNHIDGMYVVASVLKYQVQKKRSLL